MSHIYRRNKVAKVVREHKVIRIYNEVHPEGQEQQLDHWSSAGFRVVTSWPAEYGAVVVMERERERGEEGS